jgi:hypothetical protein
MQTERASPSETTQAPRERGLRRYSYSLCILVGVWLETDSSQPYISLFKILELLAILPVFCQLIPDLGCIPAFYTPTSTGFSVLKSYLAFLLV